MMTVNPFEVLENKLTSLEEAVQELAYRLPISGVHAEADLGGVKMATEIMGLSKHSIYRLVFERKIPHMKRGGKLYFSRKALLNHLEQGKRAAREEGI